jgi:hypothetical protein
MGNVRKQVKKVSRAVKKRYFKGKGFSKPKLLQMYNDIQRVRKIVNSEKKQFTLSNTAGTYRSVGAVNGNASGADVFACQPYPSQGTGDSNRTGDSIKVVSGVIDLRFIQQGSTINDTELSIELWYTAKPQTDMSSNFMKLLYMNDPTFGGSGIVTLSSHINQDYRPLFRKLAQRRLTVKADQLTGARDITNLRIPISFNKGYGMHLTYIEGSAASSVGQFALIVRANRGNQHNATTSTLAGAIDTAPDTGINYAYNITWYYYDN